MQDIQYPVSFVLRIQCASHASRGIHDARLPYIPLPSHCALPSPPICIKQHELLCSSGSAGPRPSASGALVLWLHDEGVLRIGVVLELLDAHRLGDGALAIDVGVDDRGLRVGALDGVDDVGAFVEVDEVDELDLEELGRVELCDDHGPALGLLKVRPDRG